MNDGEIAALQPGQILPDRSDQESRVLHEPRQEDSTGTVRWPAGRLGWAKGREVSRGAGVRPLPDLFRPLSCSGLGRSGGAASGRLASVRAGVRDRNLVPSEPGVRHCTPRGALPGPGVPVSRRGWAVPVAQIQRAAARNGGRLHRERRSGNRRRRRRRSRRPDRRRGLLRRGLRHGHVHDGRGDRHVRARRGLCRWSRASCQKHCSHCRQRCDRCWLAHPLLLGSARLESPRGLIISRVRAPWGHPSRRRVASHKHGDQRQHRVSLVRQLSATDRPKARPPLLSPGRRRGARQK